MAEPPPLPPSPPPDAVPPLDVPSSQPEPMPYDALLARHLVSVPAARLFVGDDLPRANWPGVEAAFSELFALAPNESILAVYDSSLFGNGRKGFVVTDRLLLVVQDESHFIRLERVKGVASRDRRLALILDSAPHPETVMLRVDEAPAKASVLAWLRAVGEHNRRERTKAERLALEEKDRMTAEKALDRLEALVASKRLSIADRGRLLDLSEGVRQLEEARRRRKRRG